MLVVLGWVGLGHTKWTHGQLCVEYLHGIYQTGSSIVLPLALTNDRVITREHSLKLRKTDCLTSLIRTNVLRFRIVNFWNSPPEETVSAPSVNSFKGRFDKEYARLRYCFDIDCVST